MTALIFAASNGRLEAVKLLVSRGADVTAQDSFYRARGAARRGGRRYRDPSRTLGPNSEITIGTPVVGNGLVFVTGGYPPVRSVYAIRPGSSSDISLQKGQESNQAIAWSNMTDGTYGRSATCTGSGTEELTFPRRRPWATDSGAI